MDAIDAASAFVSAASGGSGMQDSTMPSETHTITGLATSDSEDGLVRVDLMGYTVSADGEQSLELPTTVDVKEGDVVQVTLVGGTGKSPIVTGVVGGGDRLSNNVQDAVQTAQDAADAVAEVADVTHYFWHDDDGAHVATEPDDATTGHNTLIDSNGMYIRDGMDNLARFGASGVQVGKDDDANVNMSSSGITMTVPWWVYDYRTGQWTNNGVQRAMSISYNDEDGSAVVESPESGLTLQSSGRLKIWSNSDMMIRADFGKPVTLIADNIVITNAANTQLWSGTTQDLADALNGGSAILLYNNASGTNADITLSDSAANYEYIEIYFGKLDGTSGGYAYTRVYNPDGKRAVLNQVNTPSGYLQMVASKVLVSGNRITWDTRGMTLTFSTSARTWSYGGEENRQLIYRVVGYR